MSSSAVVTAVGRTAFTLSSRFPMRCNSNSCATVSSRWYSSSTPLHDKSKDEQTRPELSWIPRSNIEDADSIKLHRPKMDLFTDTPPLEARTITPGSRAFVDCDRTALIDLFHKYAVDCDVEGRYLDKEGLHSILKAVGENPDPRTVQKLFAMADVSGDGVIELEEFLISSDIILGDAPASIVLVVGGPGSGKGMLSKRLESECGVVHLSSGDLLRDEVRRDTVLGRQVRDIMSRGELVSSAVIVTLIRRVMRNHPGKRVLLDGFPRSLQNAHDLVTLCGKPELALHLQCDDTILMERILKRAEQSAAKKEAEGEEQKEKNSDGDDKSERRSDDNIHTALKRLRTYHKYHHPTMQWLKEQHIPVVNLDCSGTPAEIWEQLLSIGRLMRPAARISPAAEDAATSVAQTRVRGSGVVAGTNVVLSGDRIQKEEAATTTTTATPSPDTKSVA